MTERVCRAESGPTEFDSRGAASGKEGQGVECRAAVQLSPNSYEQRLWMSLGEKMSLRCSKAVLFDASWLVLRLTVYIQVL